MINNVNIWRAAIGLVKRHGAAAPIAAAQRADELLAAGDIAGCAIWARVLAAVRELERTKPGEGERVN